MAFEAGARLGPYEVIAPLGAGGMGEVYRARDTRLDRVVAVKVLPSHLSLDPDARQRFDREARTISSLNHPNICTLHDVGHQGGIDYLVMEFLEGETLADRLKKGPLPVPQLLRVGVEICEGLERAHKSGLVHRDLKPANIMLTKAAAKLMDFGLAKAAQASVVSASGLTATLSTPPSALPLTAHGTVVGTFQYMAPEQVEGREADARSDIFALGAVLYEMATAKRAFEGKSPASAMAAVLERDPTPISSLQPGTPPALERLVATCLAKDPDERWQAAHDVKLQLRQIAGGAPVSSAAAPGIAQRRRRLSGGAIAAAVFAVLAALAAGGWYRAARRPLPVVRIAMSAPEKLSFNLSGDNAGPAMVSPDGRYLVFSAVAPGGSSQLYLRPLDSLAARPLPGTDRAVYPFWSPDSRTIAFFTSTKLMRIDIDGGSPISICDAGVPRGGDWGADGTILAALTYSGPISRVTANGGTPTPVTKLDNVDYTSHRWPQFLPDGKHFLYLAVNHNTLFAAKTGVFFASLDGRENRLVVTSASNAVYADGDLLYVRDQSLVAQTFDPEHGTLSGDPHVLEDNAVADAATWRMNLSVSRTGLLVYASTAAIMIDKLAWYDRTGKIEPVVGDLGTYQEVVLSPDGKRLALSDVNTSAVHIWVYDLASKLKTRLTFAGGVTRSPVWSPDGSKLAYVAQQQSQIAMKAIAGGAPEEILYSAAQADIAGLFDWSLDGRYLLFGRGNGISNQSLWILPLTGDRKPFRYSLMPAQLVGRFSPDGRWVVYQSLEGGHPQVFVAPFPWTGERWQVSSGDGVEARWRSDGKEIYYTDFSDLMAVDVNWVGGAPRVGAAHALFPIPLRTLAQEYDVSRDGQRFIAITQGMRGSQPLTIVQNWRAQLARK